MHIHRIIDNSGNMIDYAPFCCDGCHQTWCNDDANPDYEGWDGCHEAPDYPVWCESCGYLLNAWIYETEKV